MNSDRLAQSSYCNVLHTHTHTHTHTCTHTPKLPNIMQKLVNDSQTVSKILWNLMFHCRSVYNSPPVRILSHINSFQELPNYFFMIHFSVILPLPLGLPTGLFRLGWTYNIAVCIFPCATWLANHIFIYILNRALRTEKYRTHGWPIIFLFISPTEHYVLRSAEHEGFVMLFSINSPPVLPLVLSNFAPSHITTIHSWFRDWN